MNQIISFQNLMVEPYIIEQLVDVRIKHEMNKHSTLYFRGLLADELKDNYVKDSSEGSSVSLLVNSVDGKREILFRGMVQEIEIKVSNNLYYLEVQAVSYSYLLDTKKKSRSFQDKQMSYTKLLQQVIEGDGDTVVTDEITKGANLNQLIVQYQETDWEFVKRLASHFNTGVIVDAHVSKAKLYFGVPEQGQISLQTSHYHVKKQMGKYLKLIKNGISGLQEQDFIYYLVESYAPADIGNQVTFQGQALYVYQVEAHIEKGVLLYYLTLTTKKGMSQIYQLNDRIAGSSLSAKITEIKNDQVKVALDIDEESGHDSGKPCFFPYSTIYSSKDGSGWYCMPEKGDHVRIYFPDGTEEHSYAISSVHEEVDTPGQGNMNDAASDSGSSEGSQGGGNYSGQRDDPSVKSLRNKEGKEIRLTPDGIYIIADGTTITLTDEEGVSIISEQNIEFKSEQNIILCAEQDINIIGNKGIDISCNETASIKIEENIEVTGQEVKSN